MYRVELKIKGNFVRVAVKNMETDEVRVEKTANFFYDTSEEAGRVKAENMINLWKAEIANPVVIEYMVD